MKPTPCRQALAADYRRLRRELAAIGYITQGSVFERSPSQQGSRYVWTRKVHNRTVTIALSKAQYQWLRRAAANQRKLERILRRMQQCFHRTLFETVPGVIRRKSLSPKDLDLI